jgi:hypothetical protein
MMCTKKYLFKNYTEKLTLRLCDLDLERERDLVRERELEADLDRLGEGMAPESNRVM